MLGSIGITQTTKTQSVAKLVSYKIFKDQERKKHNELNKLSIELAAKRMENTGSEVYSGNKTVNFSSDPDLSLAFKPDKLEEYISSLASKKINKNAIKKPDERSNTIYERDEQNLKPNTSYISSNINTTLNETIETTVTKTNNDAISKDSSNRSPYLVTSDGNSTNF
ncbi:hypothetical protein O181_041174 [Austropuccinia psidii MF-1]|uniref:Uncharacterized protein n=1 Tax=Austropuccinia psidii MF-1 TaxID=1389203 RepID=A0A9Q3HG85_9BASI|nr:hypothetical protein [Austropuccinia psidii MF-1]